MKLFSSIKAVLSNFLFLFYPELCAACDSNLVHQEKVLCTKCLYELPRTNFHKEKGNLLEKIFWGRVAVERVTAYFFFHKVSKYQKMIHRLKYKSQPEIGIEMGRYFAAELKTNDDFKNVDLIIPVPLHPKKLKKRGYNQSEMIAKGMEQFLHAKVDSKTLLRQKDTATQTKKTRYERWENIEDVFVVKNAHKMEGKHLLLVDDILTTGATIEACVQALQAAGNVKISIATLGYAAL